MEIRVRNYAGSVGHSFSGDQLERHVPFVKRSCTEGSEIEVGAGHHIKKVEDQQIEDDIDIDESSVTLPVCRRELKDAAKTMQNERNAYKGLHNFFISEISKLNRMRQQPERRPVSLAPVGQVEARDEEGDLREDVDFRDEYDPGVIPHVRAVLQAVDQLQTLAQ